MQLGLLTVNAAAAFSDFSRRTDIAYGNVPGNRLDIYPPAHAAHGAVVVFRRGGGWISGDKSQYKFVGAALASAGIMRNPAQAVAWTRRNARQWARDPARLYLIGHSSGAYIAVMLALDQEYLRQVGGSTHWLRGVVGLAGPCPSSVFARGIAAGPAGAERGVRRRPQA